MGLTKDESQSYETDRVKVTVLVDQNTGRAERIIQDKTENREWHSDAGYLGGGKGFTLSEYAPKSDQVLGSSNPNRDHKYNQ